jgi:hypothetical protein
MSITRIFREKKLTPLLTVYVRGGIDRQGIRVLLSE